ncbi:ATP phosphoribosyltransferase [Marinobacter sp. JH2]|uniref:ATP phosphoribosyltransferase n=1 Tax=Marinobacter sp. AL4B TaxID=2871173 RepID=UPI00105537EB|nr:MULTISPECIES: ATP phosphoribosyltransferase [unclassified Marinobacter]MBZ0333168.1 ATP phosphoribosyltransferase [Marinobacter sp. AL4B]QBM16323.1 ATP phosphoribosyltransferase [Marinobacter sp. JH2]
MTDSITIALSKGRILEETLPLLAEAGIELVDDVKKSRKLVFPTTDPNVRVLILRATDVPTYVQYGGADLGVTGKDVLMEHGGEGLYEPLDLNISRCRLMTAGKVGEQPPAGRIRVATKFVNIARRYYAAQGRQADIIKLYGAMELAPILNLADEIVDIVDTGNTLKANGLEARELIDDISTRLVVNRASMKMQHGKINPIIEMMAAAVDRRRGSSE